MAWKTVVGNHKSYHVHIAASKVDPVNGVIYQLPLEYAYNGSENFLHGSASLGGLELPATTRNGCIKKRPQDFTEKRTIQGEPLKSTGVHWKISYLFPDNVKHLIEPRIKEAKEQKSSMIVQI